MTKTVTDFLKFLNLYVREINYGHSELTVTRSDRIEEVGFIVCDGVFLIPYTILLNDDGKMTYQVGNEYKKTFYKIGDTITFENFYEEDLSDLLEKDIQPEYKNVMVRPVDTRGWFTKKLRYSECLIDPRYIYILEKDSRYFDVSEKYPFMY